MKSAILVLSLFIASAAFGDERAEKHQLVAELLEVIDAKTLTHESFANFVTSAATIMGESRNVEVPEEYRAQYEEEERKRAAEMREFQERLFSRLDYAKFFDAAYVPLFETEFTSDELRQLIGFFKTRHGQKLARLMPRLGIASGWQYIKQAGDEADEELKRERAAKHPQQKTMADMRSIATALEARATDENAYPNVGFEQLEALVVPVYIREMPKADAWGTPYLYVASETNYRIVSAGADKRFDWSSRRLDLTPVETRLSDNLDDDIIFQNGTFIQYPDDHAGQE
jgi:hypothetical protein